MSTKPHSKHIARKIWYTIAIILSVVVLLVSAVGIVATWVIERTLSDVAVTLLGVVEDTAGGLRNATSRIDQGLAQMQEITTGVEDASAKLSQNVTDQGLILLLLPAEQEEKLVAQVSAIEQTSQSIRDLLATGVNLYRSINRMPFINLPEMNQAQADQVESSVAAARNGVEELRQGVADFRSGVAGAIAKVTAAADVLGERIGDASQKVEKIDANLIALQDLAARLKKNIGTILLIVAILATLFLAFVVYTQVELIRLMVQRWRGLKSTPALLASAEASPGEVTQASPVDASPPSPAAAPLASPETENPSIE